MQADPTAVSGKADTVGEMSEDYAQPLHRGTGGGMYTRKAHATREAPMRGFRRGSSTFWGIRDDQPDAREGQAGRTGAAERLVVPLKPGNASGGKGPQLKTDARSNEGHGD